MENNRINSSITSVERTNPIFTNATLNLPQKGTIQFNENITKASFEKRIIRFHYHLIIIFLTLLLIYDLVYVLWVKFSALISFLVASMKF